MSQHWALSRNANKKKGVCTICRAIRQLKDKDGTVHRHGPRNNPCPGSDVAPLSVVDAPPADMPSSSRPVPSSVANDTVVDPAAADLPTGPPSRSVVTSQHGLPSLMTILNEVGCAVPVIKHIPKSARHSCATHLTGVLKDILADTDAADRWHRLLLWPFLVLSTPRRGGKRNQVAITIKKRISSYGDLDPLSVIKGPTSSKLSTASLADAVSAKLEDGNIRAAVRLICSDDALAPFDQNTLGQLQHKHPVPQYARDVIPDPDNRSSVGMEEADVKRAISSFPAGSSGGLDGLRPQHIKDLVNCVAGG